MNFLQTLSRDVGPILRALSRNRTGAILIALQCAITLAIVTNAIFIIQDRLTKMARPSGLDVPNLFAVRSLPFTQGFNIEASVNEDLAAIRALPGVIDATLMPSLPLSGGGSSTGLRTSPEETPGSAVAVAYYETESHVLNTLGVKLIAGRAFRPEDVRPVPPNSTWQSMPIIVTKAFADRMFPDGNALGNRLYVGQGVALEVIGIIERLQAPWIGWGQLEHSMLVPSYIVAPAWIRYLIRTEPGERDRLMPEVEKLLSDLNRNRIVGNLETQEDIEAATYSSYRAMAVILVVVIGLIVAITALGIVGLASFNVNARKKQIGTRRALGAQKSDILRYFLIESFVVTSLGVILGAGASFALSWWMVNTFDLPPLDWRYVPVGVVCLWLLGQLAVLAPARRASNLPPALATRSV